MSKAEPWQIAYEGKGKEFFQMLQSDPQNLNFVDKTGRSLLHWAACGGHLEFVKTLVSRGLDKDAKDNSCWTPLMIAVSAGRVDVVDFLIDEAKADVNVVNSTGQCPMHYAASKNQLKIAEHLFAAGANVNVRDWAGTTPLHRAISLGYLDIAKLLLDRGPPSLVSVADNEGSTALHFACEEGSMSAAKLLLEYGASFTCQNKVSPRPELIQYRVHQIGFYLFFQLLHFFLSAFGKAMHYIWLMYMCCRRSLHLPR
ncbi:hypothetical protein P879_00923 [Paragonimus westermani]|uniref:26S proteasome non-ATPase regulatory subunit 10 n=1 Tax=Paragonimus westermani TaxID=34504 RepID=A0A8T0DMS0_9TREM|nr:hypothetical protein P879_00923 [Paragonimus westermani]